MIAPFSDGGDDWMAIDITEGDSSNDSILTSLRSTPFFNTESPFNIITSGVPSRCVILKSIDAHGVFSLPQTLPSSPAFPETKIVEAL